MLNVTLPATPPRGRRRGFGIDWVVATCPQGRLRLGTRPLKGAQPPAHTGHQFDIVGYQKRGNDPKQTAQHPIFVLLDRFFKDC